MEVIKEALELVKQGKRMSACRMLKEQNINLKTAKAVVDFLDSIDCCQTCSRRCKHKLDIDNKCRLYRASLEALEQAKELAGQVLGEFRS